MARLWLFDFDGTLVDSEKAIKACYLKVGQELVPKRCKFIEKMLIGPTLDESSKIILTNKNLDLLDEFKSRFQELYDESLVFETPQFPNADNTLKKLYEKGDHLCIVTNKRSRPTYNLINYYNWTTLFDWVACMEEYPMVYTKSELIKLKNVDKKKYDKVYLVGDTIIDSQAASCNNILFIKASYGYGKNQDWTNEKIYTSISNINQLLEILD